MALVKNTTSKKQEEAKTDMQVISVKVPIEEGSVVEADTEEASSFSQAVDEVEESADDCVDFQLDRFLHLSLQDLLSEVCTRLREVTEFTEYRSLTNLIKFNAAPWPTTTTRALGATAAVWRTSWRPSSTSCCPRRTSW